MKILPYVPSTCDLDSIILQHHHHSIARFAFAGLVDGADAVLQFGAAGLIDERGLGVDGDGDFLPGAGGALAPLDLVGGGFAAVTRGFEQPDRAIKARNLLLYINLYRIQPVCEGPKPAHNAALQGRGGSSQACSGPPEACNTQM